ncbi:MAG: amino acid permease [Candidatus Aenigmarchaeota archaeon]|nr:amino acid permease [Candidatus Aenigmarchaeota archaeon]
MQATPNRRIENRRARPNRRTKNGRARPNRRTKCVNRTLVNQRCVNRTLKKNIGRKTLLFLTINAILGTGIFFLPAIGARYAGPASIISWAIFSAIALLISMYFAELVSMFPKAGGVYEYNKKAFGEFPSFLVGWLTWVLANITIAMVMVGSLYYLLPGLNVYYYILLSMIIIVFFSYLNYRGVRQSTTVLMIFGIITLAVLFSLIFPGIFFINNSNYVPFAPYGIAPVFLAMFFISETFFGWETTCFFAEEVKNARKVMPKVLILSTAIIAAISLLLVAVSVGMVNWSMFADKQAPLQYLASVIYGNGMGRILGIVMFIALLGTVAGWIISSPRLLFAMSRDRVLPKSLSELSKYSTPRNAIIFQMLISIIITIVGLGSYGILLSMLIPLVIISYSSVLLSLIKLRLSRPDIKRHFSAPFPVAGAIVVLLFIISMLVYWLINVEGAFRLFFLDIILLFFGIPLYFLIKMQYDTKFIEKFFNAFPLWDVLFPLWYGQKERNIVISKLKLSSRDRVLDFGCGSGITTLEIAKKVGKGEVLAVDISRKQLERSSCKIDKTMRMPNVILVHESTMPFRKNSFDAVVSVCVLCHLSNPEPAIKKMMRVLKKGGHFSFMEFGKTFGIPEPEFLHNVKKIFYKMGIKVNVRKEKKRFAEYWYIWGEK